METEIIKTMASRKKTGISKLDFGDLVLIRNYKNSSLDLKGTGPGIFLEFTNSTKDVAIVYHTCTKRVHRVNI